MSSTKESYRKVIKSTSLFGGVQVIQILTSLVRGKLVAIFLGASGMGIFTLFNSAILMIVQFSSLGLNFSAVREISKATEKGDLMARERIIVVFKRCVLFSAVLGFIVMISLAHQLSMLTFGNFEYTVGFLYLAVVIVFTILSNANVALLQGLGQLKNMAKASVFGAISGVLVSVPLYYKYGTMGIIFGFISSSIVVFMVSMYFTRGIKIRLSDISWKDTLKEGSGMTKLGIVMMLASLIGTAVNYLSNAYVAHYGSVSDVGLFGAGMAMTNQYVGVVFTAMAVEYFPRLSAVSDNNDKVNEMVNQQAEVVLLIISPLLIGLMIASPLLIRILLSSHFLPIRDFICWSCFSMVFKGASFAMGYISFAKGDKKVFFFFEGVFNSSVTLIANIIGYRYGGINGIAIATVVSTALYLINISLIVRRRYDFKFNSSLLKIFFISAFLLGIALVIMLNFSTIYSYVIGTGLLMLSAFYSFVELDKRINILSFIRSKTKL